MSQPALFDPSATVPAACPAQHCQAVRLPGQDRVPTCAHDLNPETRKRPRGCLNSIDPATEPIPFQMTPEEAVPLLARWTNELRVDLLYAQRTITALEARVQRLEHAARLRALERRTRTIARERAG